MLFIIIVATFSLFYKQLKFVTFDAETATAHGLNARVWLLLFYLTVGIGISITTRFVGDVFTFAYLIIPASIGIILSKRVSRVFITAIMVGAVLPPISIYFAFELDISSGPTAVVFAVIVFLIIYIIKKIKG